MKKISSYLPQHVINKRDLLSDMNAKLNNILVDELKKKVEIVSIKDNILIVNCENSSIATLMRFEKNRYLKKLNQSFHINLLDIKITL